MGVNDVTIIGVGKDAYSYDLDEMIDGRILPWMEDIEEDGYPVWTAYGAAQRRTYFLNRDGELIHQFDITSLDPTVPEDYAYLINLILDFRAEAGPNVIRVPDDISTIQGGIDVANNNDIVLVDPGTYVENITFHDKNITLASLLYSGTNSDNIGEAIIDGNDNGSVVTINGDQNETSILLGFTIQNGWATEAGGGIYIEDANPIIDRNIILENHAGDCGGTGAGIAVLNEASPLIVGNQFIGNEVSGVCDCICYFGGGIYVDETSWPIVGGTVSTTNSFTGNSADTGYDLFRSIEGDTTTWSPIFAHHNTFEECPPSESNVFPLNGWDIENCHSILNVDKETSSIPYQISLLPNYPNPFNPTTTIRFFASSASNITLNIYDINGRIIVTKSLKLSSSGYYETSWNASPFPSGVYFIQLDSRKNIQTQKALFVK